MNNYQNRMEQSRKRFNLFFGLVCGFIALVFVLMISYWVVLGIGVYKVASNVESPEQVGQFIGRFMKGVEEGQNDTEN